MNYFNKISKWTNTELMLFKICMLSFYICVGAYFQSFIRQYYGVLLTIFVLSLIVLLFLWFTKIKNRTEV